MLGCGLLGGEALGLCLLGCGLLGGDALGLCLLGCGLLGGDALGLLGCLLGRDALGFRLLGCGLLSSGTLGLSLLRSEAFRLGDALGLVAVGLLDGDDREDQLRRLLDAKQLSLDQPAHHLAGLEQRETALTGQLGHRPLAVDLAQQCPLVRAELDRLRRGLSRGQHGHG